MTNNKQSAQRRIRIWLWVFIIGLILSGVTAFPLSSELELLSTISEKVGIDQTGFGKWIAIVHHGLIDTYAKYPWVGYGTDWLAFAHIVIAIFFIGPLRDPVRNVWVLKAGLLACFLVVPLALICGEVRQIPFGWRLIDCSFGVFGAIPLWYCLKLTRLIENA
jgi:hypothetical protein